MSTPLSAYKQAAVKAGYEVKARKDGWYWSAINWVETSGPYKDESEAWEWCCALNDLEAI